ncbi:flagellar export chaperone FliS [Flocculibacter collagenilyticus]|uniref:flagellar export chaperone FliS n=1 Tax=Flocculibacter collagenilyticus TaxID=2744479 RepID=UPI0018F6FCFD|nr:flagellar export chaperone FliS [Flocculibacter collagenilyticus]
MSRASIQKYKAMKINAAANANPYELITIVLTNIIGKLSGAKAHIERNDTEQKGKLISDSITLVGALQDSLNMNDGGDVSNNLYNLYDYAQRTLLEANLNNSTELLDVVIEIMRNIKEGWEAIPHDVKEEFLTQKAVNG